MTLASGPWGTAVAPDAGGLRMVGLQPSVHLIHDAPYYCNWLNNQTTLQPLLHARLYLQCSTD